MSNDTLAQYRPGFRKIPVAFTKFEICVDWSRTAILCWFKFPIRIHGN